MENKKADYWLAKALTPEKETLITKIMHSFN